MTALIIAGATATALTAIVLFAKTIWPLVRQSVRIADAIDIIVGDDTRPGICKRLDDIELQLLPNDGKSLRDRVDYIALQCTELQRTAVETDSYIFDD